MIYDLDAEIAVRAAVAQLDDEDFDAVMLATEQVLADPHGSGTASANLELSGSYTFAFADGWGQRCTMFYDVFDDAQTVYIFEIWPLTR